MLLYELHHQALCGEIKILLNRVEFLDEMEIILVSVLALMHPSMARRTKRDNCIWFVWSLVAHLEDVMYLEVRIAALIPEQSWLLRAALTSKDEEGNHEKSATELLHKKRERDQNQTSI